MADVELERVSQIRELIEAAHRQNVTSPADDAILDICERLTELINDLALREVRRV